MNRSMAPLLLAAATSLCSLLHAPILQAATTVAASTPAPFWARRVTGYLTTRDGVKLRYSALLPDGPGPFPVIVNYSGYDAGSIGGAAYLTGDTTMSANLDRTFLQHGYAVVGVNARGTGCSEGVMGAAGPSYGQDGRDAIEFIAGQSWSDGRIGMANWSWAGISQLATAIEQPPHLKAIAPGMVVADDRLDNAAPGGVSEPVFGADWWDYIRSRWDAARQSADAEHDTACLNQIATNLTTGEPFSPVMEALRHPARDAVVDQRRLSARTAKIQVPVLSMESFQDEAVSSREGYYQQTLDPKQVWTVQTNGGHDLYESLRFRTTLVAFMDRFVKGESNGFDARPHVEIWFETGSAGKESHARYEGATPRFTAYRDLLPVTVSYKTLHLSDQGRLQEEDGRGSPDGYAYPRPGPTVDLGADVDAWGPMSTHWRQGSLAYTSAPLRGPLVTYGPASADLWLSSTAIDTDLQVTLTELRPDGEEVFIQRGWLRLSDRAIDADQATPVHPALKDRPESLEPMTQDVPVLARVELNKFAYAFRAGSRVRVWIDTPSNTGSYGFNYVALPAVNRVWHDAEHPSKLVLGVLPDVSPPVTRPACGSVLKEPCRRDPLVKLTAHKAKATHPRPASAAVSER